MIVGFNKIFLGMILTILHFTLNINEFSITFIPQFIAYIVVLVGIKEALSSYQSLYLEKAKVITIIQIVFYFIIFLMGLGFRQASLDNIIFNGLEDVLELMSVAFIIMGKGQIKLAQGKEYENIYYMERAKYYLIIFIGLVLFINIVGFIGSTLLGILLILIAISIKIWVLYLIKKE